jgi:lariat debranching enzyme
MAAPFLRIAVVGCSHGELDEIYATVARENAASADGRPVDLVICCGDFQAVRNGGDLACMACPPKYRAMGCFWRYYKGDTPVPVPTLFIGGNHEASNHAAELPLGGWAAPGIYFLGSAGVVAFGGLRIGGLSGIFKAPDYPRGFFEAPPYAGAGELHSANHARAFDVARLATLAGAPRALELPLR